MAPGEPIIWFDWMPSSYFGWGVYGFNLMLHWPGRALTTTGRSTIDSDDKAQFARLKPLLDDSKKIAARLATLKEKTHTAPVPVFRSYGNNLNPVRAPYTVDLWGTPSIGVAFVEDSVISHSTQEAAKPLKAMVAASSWNADLFGAVGLANIRTVLQGVDTTLFRPLQPRGTLLPGKFKIFSGGKLEFRKGQDLALAAFHAFATRHDDATLVTAWHSPWPKVAASFAGISQGAPQMRSDGALDLPTWIEKFGIDPMRIADAGPLPNRLMPELLREMDAALFPNRAEGGTNLVAMEAIAAGVPTILSANTGHLDIIALGGSWPLERQKLVSHAIGMGGTAGWGESDVEEMVENLEAIYTKRAEGKARAVAGAAAMKTLSWKNQIGKLYEALAPLL
jgi:glycosyltransferase involved in cell wall biosynthesis